MVQNITDCIGRWIYWIRSAQEIYATEFNLHLWRGWPSRCCGNLRPRRINKQLFIILTVVPRQPDDLLWKKNNSPAHPGRNLSWESSRGTPFLLEGDMLEREGVFITLVALSLLSIYRWHDDSMDLWINLYESLRVSLWQLWYCLRKINVYHVYQFFEKFVKYLGLYSWI